MKIQMVSFVWKPEARGLPGVRWNVYDIDGALVANNAHPREARWRALCLAREATVKTGRRVHVRTSDWPARSTMLMSAPEAPR